MANKFYAPGQDRAGKVRDLFGTIAARYDLINDLQSMGLHRRWKKRLVQISGVQSGALALDLCCGTGDIVLALARQGATAVGLDFSLPMLRVAQQRAAEWRNAARGQSGSEARDPRGHDDRPGPGFLRNEVYFLQGDALALPFCDAQFDAVTISYGLRNLRDIRLGLVEMKRVLKPGGRLAILDFGKPDHAFWRRVYFGYLQLVVPLFGRLFFGDRETYAYILESLLHYPGQRAIARLMDELEFDGAGIVEVLGGMMAINYGIKAGVD